MKLSRVNTFLFVAIIVVNTYVMVLPITPRVIFWWHSQHSSAQAQLIQKVHASTPIISSSTPPQESDRIIIPAMLLDQPLYEGRDERTLNKGLWLRTAAGTPDRGGNTVIVGHRFTYTNPRGTLYFLNKVAVGDEIAVIWQGKKYIYRVKTTAVVPPTATQVETPTKTAQLTIYTCTPLWNPKDRLVVIATPEEIRP